PPPRSARGPGRPSARGAWRSRLRRGDAEGAVGGIGRALENPLAGLGRAGLVWPEDVLEGDDVRRRVDPVEVEGADALDVLEDGRELPGHPLDLVGLELEPREPGHVQHLFAVDHPADSRYGRPVARLTRHQ